MAGRRSAACIPSTSGAAPSSEGPRVERVLTASGLRQVIAFISRMTAADRAELEGISSDRSHQVVAGALVAGAPGLAGALGVAEVGDPPVDFGVNSGGLAELLGEPGGIRK